MKTIIRSVILLALALCLLLCALPAGAQRYVWEDGVLPENWTRNNVAEDITATNILQPINPNATQEAKNLYAYLCTVTDSKQLITGQFDLNNNNSVYEKVIEQQGFEPGLYSAHYSMSYPNVVWASNDPKSPDYCKIANDCANVKTKESTNALLKMHYDNGNILLVHADRSYRDPTINYLLESGKYFDVMNMIREFDKTNPDRDMRAYSIWLHHVNSIIDALQDLEDRGVKAYMYRDLVEMNYHGFFSDNDAFARVYQQEIQMLIDSGLTGFLTVYSPGANSNTIANNSGNDYFDVYSVTLYGFIENQGHFEGTQFPNYDWYVKTGKPIGCSEFSCRRGESDIVGRSARSSWFSALQDVMTYWPNISWVNCWGDAAYSLIEEKGGRNGNDDAVLFLDSPFTLNLSELPDYRNTNIAAPGVAQLYTTADGSGNYIGLEEKAYTASDVSKLGIKLADVGALRLNTGYSITFYSNANLTGDSFGYVSATKNISSARAAKFRSFKVEAIKNIALDTTEIYASDNDESAGKANDGQGSVWTGNVDPSTGEAWLYIDLGEAYSIARYGVKTAAYAKQDAMYNVKSFRLEASNDDETWKTVNAVTDNTLGEVKRDIPTTTAQYFRLVITEANTSRYDYEKGLVTIAEFELFGLPALAEDYPAGPTLYNDNGTWVYVVDGVIATGYTGLVNYGGTYYFVNKGYVDWNTETLVNYGGSWWHVKGGKVVFDSTLVNYGGSWYYVGGGKVDFGATGLCNYGGTYYYVNKGVVDFKTETLVNYSGAWWHVKGGKVVFDTTLVNYGGNWYYVGGGKVDFGATGLCNYGGTYYYVNKGVVDFKTETLVNYSGAWWHVKGGKVVFDTTLVKYGNTWYYVAGGKVNFSASGKFNYYGTNYNIVNGVVKF